MTQTLTPKLAVEGEAPGTRRGWVAVRSEVPTARGPIRLCALAPEAPVRLADIVPLARGLADRVVEHTVAGLRSEGKALRCRKGCSACCRFMVPMSVPEVFALGEDLQHLPPRRRERIGRRFQEAAGRILQTPPPRLDGEAPERRLRDLSDWYAGLGLACPLLSDDCCTLYAQRPLACREHFVALSAEDRPIGAGRLHPAAAMPVRVVEAVGRLAAEAERTDLESVIVPLALSWRSLNQARGRRTFPAAALVERLFEIMSDLASESLRREQVAA